MDTFAKPVRMNPEMTKLLDQMRASDQPYPVYHQPPETADEQVCAVGQSLVTDANLQFATRNQYMWYVRELARLLRTRYGRDLAFHLELVMRKWQTLGLSPNIMQIIACEIHNSLKPAEAILPNVSGTRTKSEANSQQPKAKAAKGEEREAGGEPTAKAAKSAKGSTKDEGQRTKQGGKEEMTKSEANGERREANGEATAKSAKAAMTGKDEVQSPKDKASQKDEVRSPKDEANPQEGKSEVRNPNGEERTANSAEAAP